MKSSKDPSVDCTQGFFLSSGGLWYLLRSWQWDSYTCSMHGFVWTRLDYSTTSLSGPGRALLQICTEHFFSKAGSERTEYTTDCIPVQRKSIHGCLFFFCQLSASEIVAVAGGMRSVLASGHVCNENTHALQPAIKSWLSIKADGVVLMWALNSKLPCAWLNLWT